MIKSGVKNKNNTKISGTLNGNGASCETNGWKYVSIWGEPKERGYAYGAICAKDFEEIQKMLVTIIPIKYGLEWSWFVETIGTELMAVSKKNAELFNEMTGIVEGCNSKGVKTTIKEIITWNYYISIPYWWNDYVRRHKKNNRVEIDDRCSAFMAVGKDWTSDGKIIAAHNTFTWFYDVFNIVLDIRPTKGNRIVMQTSPLFIWSGSDFFITSAGFIGCETTIDRFDSYKKQVPRNYRLRRAAQYANTLDEYEKYLLQGNGGDAASSWLIGDTNTNEIMRFELGQKYHNTTKTKNGYFIGFNSTYDNRIRNIECNRSTNIFDIQTHIGSRKVRLTDLMDKHKGKINLSVAKQILSDHYDVYLLKNNPSSRTVCSHYNLDNRQYSTVISNKPAYSPKGAIDGKVCDSNMAKRMQFLGRIGNTCGKPFNSKSFFSKHKQWKIFEPVIKNKPSQPWTLLPPTKMLNAYKNNTKSKTKNNIKSKTKNNTKNNIKSKNNKTNKRSNSTRKNKRGNYSKTIKKRMHAYT